MCVKKGKVLAQKQEAPKRRKRLQAVAREDTLDLEGKATSRRGRGDSRGLVVEAEHNGAAGSLEARRALRAHLELGGVVVARKSKVLLALEGRGSGAPGVRVLELVGKRKALRGRRDVAGGGSEERAVSADHQAASEADASDLRKPCIPAAHLVVQSVVLINQIHKGLSREELNGVMK